LRCVTKVTANIKIKNEKNEKGKRAWSIFRSPVPHKYKDSFSASLKRAWQVEKENIEWEEAKRKKAAEPKPVVNRDYDINRIMSHCAPAIEDYYACRHGRYCGD
jgi:hypothetical protein